MPRIPTYTAKDDILRPPEQGFSAYETAARRTGTAYDQAGQEAVRQGQARADIEKESLFPYSIARVQQANRSGGAGFRVKGSSSDPFGIGNEGIVRRGPNLARLNQISAGAPNLAALARGLVGSHKSGLQGKLIDVGEGSPDVAGQLVSPLSPEIQKEAWRDPTSFNQMIDQLAPGSPFAGNPRSNEDVSPFNEPAKPMSDFGGGPDGAIDQGGGPSEDFGGGDASSGWSNWLPDFSSWMQPNWGDTNGVPPSDEVQ